MLLRMGETEQAASALHCVSNETGLASLATIIRQPFSLETGLAYATQTGGSGFRYALAEHAGQASGLDASSSRIFADAVEHFHLASLVFDDLPSMDDAIERRGQPCLHRICGEGTAQLVGLALVNRAYVSCWKASTKFPVRSAMAARLLDRCIGERGILDGQARDLDYDPSAGSTEVEAIAAGKTGTLLRLTLLLPAVCAGADWRVLLALTRVARAWGVAYQGLDDFSDLLIVGTDSGKTPYQDVRNARPNLVLALGEAAAGRRIEMLLDLAARHIDELNHATGNAWDFLTAHHRLIESKLNKVKAHLEAA